MTTYKLHDQVGFNPGKQGCFISELYSIHHNNRLNIKNQKNVLIDAKKSYDKPQHHLMNKNTQTRNTREYSIR